MLTSNGRARRRHTLGAYIILHRKRHALQWARNSTRIVRGDIHKHVHATIVVLRYENGVHDRGREAT